ncbi:unnamed protein product [Adineta ricciae]|uniref:Uncharacterized protein n=1 Tax=Adineta ricciae TaxID=249248 RepID=A0A814TLT7_ADIRI|nr:unnamed protein product [Adineta ricciae]CAF1233321.1 unnamed protein product [Adineta ricciae]
MPLEHAEWYSKQSAHANDKLQARQCCTYYSVVNMNQNNHPFVNSYEQQQTWTLSRTMATHNKRYQSSIENIFLTTPKLSLKAKTLECEKIRPEKDRLVPFLASSRPSFYNTIKSYHHQNENSIPVKSILNNNSKLRNNASLRSSPISIRPMRVIHMNGELIVRI